MLSFEDWQSACIDEAAEWGLHVNDMFDEGDPRDLEQEALAAFANDVSPAAFIKEIFAEDIANIEAGDAEAESIADEWSEMEGE
jgi:hypothetical protein